MQPNTTRNLALKLKYLPFLGVVSCAHSRSFMGAFDFFLFAERWSANADHPQKRASNGGKRWWYNHRKNTKIMVVDAWEKEGLPDIHNKHSKYLNPLKTTKNLLKMKRKKKLMPKFWIVFFFGKKTKLKNRTFLFTTKLLSVVHARSHWPSRIAEQTECGLEALSWSSHA